MKFTRESQIKQIKHTAKGLVEDFHVWLNNYDDSEQGFELCFSRNIGGTSNRYPSIIMAEICKAVQEALDEKDKGKYACWNELNFIFIDVKDKNLDPDKPITSKGIGLVKS